jgi:hypothetical protein
MSETFSTLELIDFYVELREENERLVNQLLFAQKCMKLFENYRNLLNDFSNDCKCDENFEIKLKLYDLEKQYKSLVKEDIKRCGVCEEVNTRIAFIKRQKLSANKDKTDSEVIETPFESQLSDNKVIEDSDNQQLIPTTDQTNGNKDKDLISSKYSFNS